MSEAGLQWEEQDGREDPAQRFAVYRLCECEVCFGRGKLGLDSPAGVVRCAECRGEGRVKQLLATCGTAEAVGVALVTLGREGEFEECPVGILDRQGEPGQKWLVKPWLPSARNVSDAGRLLASKRNIRD